MDKDDLDIVAINKASALVLFSDGVVCAVMTFLDADGEETGDISRARAFVVERDGSYYAAPLRDYQPEELH